MREETGAQFLGKKHPKNFHRFSKKILENFQKIELGMPYSAFRCEEDGAIVNILEGLHT